MPFNGAPRRGHGAVPPADELTRLRAELENERLRFEVALAVVVSIQEEVPLASDQTLVIEDLITRWRVLPLAERAFYRAFDSGADPVTRFVRDAVDRINAQPLAGYTDATYPPEPVAAAMRRRHWQRYVARLREASGPGGSGRPGGVRSCSKPSSSARRPSSY